MGHARPRYAAESRLRAPGCRQQGNARGAGPGWCDVDSPTRAAVLLGLLFGLAGTSTSAVTVALPQLAAELGIGHATAAWIVSGYAVALAVATPTHGRLADMVGIRLPLCLGVGRDGARRARRGARPDLRRC